MKSREFVKHATQIWSYWCCKGAAGGTPRGLIVMVQLADRRGHAGPAAVGILGSARRAGSEDRNFVRGWIVETNKHTKRHRQMKILKIFEKITGGSERARKSNEADLEYFQRSDL